MSSRLTRACSSALSDDKQKAEVSKLNLPFELEIGEPWPTVLTKLEEYGWKYRSGSGIYNEYYIAPHISRDKSLKGLEVGVDYVCNYDGLKEYAKNHYGWIETPPIPAMSTFDKDSSKMSTKGKAQSHNNLSGKRKNTGLLSDAEYELSSSSESNESSDAEKQKVHITHPAKIKIEKDSSDKTTNIGKHTTNETPISSKNETSKNEVTVNNADKIKITKGT